MKKIILLISTLALLLSPAIAYAGNFAMGVNRYADRDIDSKNPRTQNRPNVDGRINASTISTR